MSRGVPFSRDFHAKPEIEENMLTPGGCRKSKHFAMEERGQAGRQKQVSFVCSTILVSLSTISHI